MEPLVFAIVALHKEYRQQETRIPEPAEFLPFDLRALKRPYDLEADSSSRPSNRQNSLATQIAS